MDSRAPLPAVWTDALLARTMPAAVANHRVDRFRGEALRLPLSALGEGDRAVARDLYAWLGTIEAATTPEPGALPTTDGLRAHLAAHPSRSQVWAMQTFGRETPVRDEDSLVAKVVHDVRGGPLTSLLMMLQRVESGRVGSDDLLRVHYRVRDHRKIMRAALPGIDDAGRERDQTLKRHDVGLLTEKWSQATVPVAGVGGDGDVRVRLDQRFQGAVCESCIEFTALDRVIYNLINNALRHASDGGVHVVLSAVPSGAPTSLHVAVANRVDAGEAAALRGRFGDELVGLFEGTYSTTGSGLGLRICADMVGNAYGVDDAEDCAAAGYVGALLGDGVFAAWAHWPLAGD